MPDTPHRPGVLETVAELRAAAAAARAGGGNVGLVPTMGSLHDGHRSLVRRARAECDLVVISIFVNPMQFGPHEDFDRYPRDLAADLEACAAERADLVFAPSLTELYPVYPSPTIVHVDGLTERLCGADRPGHFDGVTTVVAKLFSVTAPCRAYFGRKDAQQLAVVTRMASDLTMAVDVIGCPLVREADGLALSSRNDYLSPPDRAAAPKIFAALRAGAALVTAGESETAPILAAVRATLAGEPRLAPEYVECVDAATMAPVGSINGSALIAVAVRVGGTRLIDNVGVFVESGRVELDLGTGWVPPRT